MYWLKQLICPVLYNVGYYNSSGSRGAGDPGPPSPHFWGPRLYSEGQIAPFYTQITENFSKKFCLALLGILFQFSIDIFWSKTLENYSSLRPQIIFWGPNYTFLYTNNTKIKKKNFCLASLGILFKFSIDIFWSKTLGNYSFLRPQIIFWFTNYTFLHSNNTKIKKKILPCFTRHTIQILNWHILIKNIRKLFIFEAPDYLLSHKLHLFTLK